MYMYIEYVSNIKLLDQFYNYRNVDYVNCVLNVTYNGRIALRDLKTFLKFEFYI
jgi:hypothetical protein